MTTAQGRLSNESQTTATFRQVVEAHDVEGVLRTLAPNAVLRSPITDRVVFRGDEEIRELLHSVFATIHDIRYFADVGDRRTRALVYRADVLGQRVEEATRVELDETGKIREITLFFRPLPGVAMLAAGLAPRVAAKHGRLRSLIARVLIFPLGLFARLGDRLVPWFT